MLAPRLVSTFAHSGLGLYFQAMVLWNPQSGQIVLVVGNPPPPHPGPAPAGPHQAPPGPPSHQGSKQRDPEDPNDDAQGCQGT